MFGERTIRMRYKNFELVLEDVSNYCPSGLTWKDHFKKVFGYQTWNDRTETAWLFRAGKFRLMLVKEKPEAIAQLQAEAKKSQELDKVA
jgi:hypothetical protein